MLGRFLGRYHAQTKWLGRFLWNLAWRSPIQIYFDWPRRFLIFDPWAKLWAPKIFFSIFDLPHPGPITRLRGQISKNASVNQNLLEWGPSMPNFIRIGYAVWSVHGIHPKNGLTLFKMKTSVVCFSICFPYAFSKFFSKQYPQHCNYSHNPQLQIFWHKICQIMLIIFFSNSQNTKMDTFISKKTESCDHISNIFASTQELFQGYSQHLKR